MSYRELVCERMGDDWYELSLDEQRRRAEEAGVDLDPAWDALMVSHEVYEKLIEKSLRNPTFVTRLPASLIPLARACEDDAACADVFELVIAGQVACESREKLFCGVYITVRQFPGILQFSPI